MSAANILNMAYGSATGPAGPVGPRGLQGFQGFQGLGLAGMQGFQGDQGLAGPQGFQGDAGTSGSETISQVLTNGNLVGASQNIDFTNNINLGNSTVGANIRAVVMATDSNVSGNSQTVIGHFQNVSGGNNNVLVGGSYAFAIGSTVVGNDCIAIGRANSLTGNRVIAIGSASAATTINGSDVVSIGRLNAVTGSDCFVVGESNTITATNSGILGFNITNAGRLDDAGPMIQIGNSTQETYAGRDFRSAKTQSARLNLTTNTSVNDGVSLTQQTTDLATIFDVMSDMAAAPAINLPASNATYIVTAQGIWAGAATGVGIVAIDFAGTDLSAYPRCIASAPLTAGTTTYLSCSTIVRTGSATNNACALYRAQTSGLPLNFLADSNIEATRIA